MPHQRRCFFWCERSALIISMLALIALTALMSLSGPVSAFKRPSWASYSRPHSNLADLALQKVLQDASPVFGKQHPKAQSRTATWMKDYPDDTPIVHMNIPGSHDTATWNYSSATQQALDHVTNLVGINEIDPTFWRCQDLSMLSMLDAGIRVFDLRYAFDVTNSTLVFWHGPALQSQTATVDDVLFGFYHWLDEHPSEAVFLSFQYQGSTAPYAMNDAGVQKLLFESLTSPAAKKYILQTRGSIGTLGEARGKVTLFRRFDLDQLPSYYDNALPGIHFSPNDWTDNGPNITLVYNASSHGTAYIQDYYMPQTPQGSSDEENIIWKMNATISHLDKAATTHSDSLFWNFASSTNIVNKPPNTPHSQALGSGSETPEGGVNQRLLSYLQKMKGKRLGIVMFDFFETPEELVPTLLSLKPAK